MKKFINLKERNFSWKGDRLTWIRFDDETKEVEIHKAGSGLISSEYLEAIWKFCEKNSISIDINEVRKGETATATAVSL